MAESIIKDQKKVMPCAAWLEGEYGIENVFLGVPVVLGAKGIERIIEFKLTEDEKEAMKLSVEAVKKQMAATGI
jgi:malate dehydrogenase